MPHLTRSLLRDINWLLGAAGFLLVLLSLMWHTHHSYQANIDRELQQVEDTCRNRLPWIAGALWNVDPQQIRQELDALAAQPNIVWVELATPLGETHTRGEQRLLSSAKNNRLSLEINHPESRSSLGILTVHMQNKPGWAAMRPKWLALLGSHLILLIALLLLLNQLLKKRLLSRLDKLVNHLNHVYADTLDQLPDFLPTKDIYDEIDRATASLSSMQQRLSRDFAIRQQSEAAAMNEQIRLEGEVARRAGEAIYLSGFLNQLSRLSSDFLILPPARVDAALRDALQEISVFLGLDTCFVVAMDESNRAEIRSFWRKSNLPVAPLEVYLNRSRDDFLASFKLLEKEKTAQVRTTELPPDSTEACLAAQLNLAVLTLVRLESPDQIIGLFCGGLVRSDRTLNEMECRLISMTGNIVANLLLHRRQQLALASTETALNEARQLLNLHIRHDPLTGLSNAQAFNDALPAELRRAQRTKTSLALLLVEVTCFVESVEGNDTIEATLRIVGQEIMRLVSRTGDLAARIDNSRFALLLPDTPEEGSQSLAQRLIGAISARNIAAIHQHDQRIRACMALVRLAVGADIPPDRLLSLADQALQRARLSGDEHIETVDIPA